MDYDRKTLQRLGAKRQRLQRDLADTEQQLDTEVITAARAGLAQVDIINDSGYSRDKVRRVYRAAGI